MRFALFSAGIWLLATLLSAATQRIPACLPNGITATDVVSAQLDRSSNAVRKITVAQKLSELKARCKSGKLVDGAGKPIYFYRLEGCWGNPPADYREILEHQNKQLEKLRKRYTVIEMTCNPDGAQLH